MGTKIASGGGGGVGTEYVAEEYAERPELLIRDIVTQFESMGSTNIKGMSLKTLDSEITEQTGRAWAERYKSLHGTISKFAESKPHLFDMKDSVISVVEGANFDDQPLQAPASVHPPAPPTPSSWGAADVRDGEKSTSWAKVAATPILVDCTEKCWFDFNDMTVSPVSVKELEKYYEGCECAHVLFYRRKVALSALVPGIPSHMEEEMTYFNNSLNTSRSNYKEKTSQVTVMCYPASSLEFDGVALRPARNNLQSFKLVIDRRWTLAQTKTYFFQMLCQQPEYINCPEVSTGRGAVELHLLRQCVTPTFDGGNTSAMHVYELLGSGHVESWGIGTCVKDNMMILLWNRDGSNWPQLGLCVGPETEALALFVSYLNPSRPIHVAAAAKGGWGEEEANHRFYGPPPEGVWMLARKDWTLGYLRQKLSKELRAISACQSTKAVIHRLDRTHSLGGNLPLCLDHADDSKTLDKLQLKQAKCCWLCVELMDSAGWQESCAFKAFRWTNDGRTRVYVELPLPNSVKLSAHVDVSWDLQVSEVKKKAHLQLREQVKALPDAAKIELASTSPRKEWRFVLLCAGWGEEGFSVTDETTTLRDIYVVCLDMYVVFLHN